MSTTSTSSGNFVRVKLFDELLELFVRVGPITRPPGSEDEARRQRNASCDAGVVAQLAAIIVTIGEEYQSWCGAVGRGMAQGHSLESKRGRKVSSIITQPSRESRPLSRGTEPLAPSSVRGGAAEIAGVLHAGIPRDGFAVEREFDGKILGSEGAGFLLVA